MLKISLIYAHAGEKVLTHIDAVPDNFLFVEKEGREEIRLIDWEYAGMQDPHVDVAMFCMRLFWMAIRLFIILKSLHRNLNALDITVFGQMVKRMSGCRLLRMALLRLAAGQVGKADGSCTVFPAGRQRMGKG